LNKENDMGNFSGNTFRELMNYVSVRLQQGVPLLDADWNELDDIRRHELRSFLKWFVCDGIPKGNDGFRIQPTGIPSNDFIIKTGRCLVNGWEVSNPENLLYSEQQLEDESADHPTPLPSPITTEITVYLEVWEREVKDTENLVYKKVNFKSSVRLKREWVVRWVEGRFSNIGNLPEAIKKPDHSYYILAIIKGGIPNITTDIIKDLRRTIFADFIWPSQITIKDGNVGIGTTDPGSTLDVGGTRDSAFIQNLATWGLNARVQGIIIIPEGNVTDDGAGKLTIPVTIIMNPISGSWIRVNAGTYELGNWGSLWAPIPPTGTRATTVAPTILPWTDRDRNYDGRDRVLLAQRRGLGPIYTRFGVRANYTGNAGAYFMHNVGIGTTDPKYKLDVHGEITSRNVNAFRLRRDNYGLFLRNDDHDIYMLLTDSGSPDESWNDLRPFKIQNSTGNIYFGKDTLSVQHPFTNEEGVKQSGNVGIGTTDPKYKLDVHGEITSRNVNAFRLRREKYGLFLRNDDQDIYMLLTNSGSPDGSWNNLRPFKIQNSTGNIYFGIDTLSVQHPFTNEEGVKQSGNVGIGTADPGKDKLYVSGRCFSTEGWHATNGDYAEYFESDDGNAIPIATSVVLTTNGKIRAAKKQDVPIGITTENSAMVGNSYREWPLKYLRDKYDRPLMEKVKEEILIPKREKIKKERQKVKKILIEEVVEKTEIIIKNKKYRQIKKMEKIKREVEEPVFDEVDLFDSEGKEIIGKHRIPIMETYEEEVDVKDKNGEPVLIGSGKFNIVEKPKLNPEYDEKLKYISRSERKEWCCVGLLGQVVLQKGMPVAPTWVKIKDLPDDMELCLVK
jgi:hypothetical protein